jgi:predicted TIM-barrel fold metal-dependent hydrolase
MFRGGREHTGPSKTTAAGRRRGETNAMTYASGRTFYDADSHIMELPDFLKDYSDPGMRDRMPSIAVPRVGPLANLLEDAKARRAHTPERVAELVGLGDTLIAGPKGYGALGAFNAGERTAALDLLGFAKQLVFATFSEGVAFSERRPIEDRYAAARAHNRAMAEFCAADKRLHGVALLPLDVSSLALAELDHIIKSGLKAAWVPHRPCGGRSPGHTDLDPVWARLAEAGIPFVLHVGGHPLQIGPEWMNTGRKVPTDWLGGGENVRGKDMTSLHHAAETFIGTMVLDGVLERHPTLRGGIIELGAGWAPSMITRLDWVAEIWKKSEPELAALKRKPSEQITAQLAFTPFVYENVGELIRQSDERLYLFSSDYPHTEGGRAPLARFEASLAGHDEDAKEHFYSRNFARLFEAA